MDADIKPTIYLVKENITDPKRLIKKEIKLLSKEFGDFTLFYAKSKTHAPSWAQFVVNGFDTDIKNFKNSASKAIIVIKLGKRMMVVPMGGGIHALDLTAFEYNFGLKTALNCISKTAIRQVDMTTPEVNSQKTKKQTAVGTTPEAFGINKQKDILRGMTGKLSKDHPLGTSLDGRDGLRVTAGVAGLDRLKSLCQKALDLYQKDTYKKDYGWIDNIALVRDVALIENLTKALAKALSKGKFEHMHFVSPEFYELIFDYQGFAFTTGDGSHASKKDKYEMPDMADWNDSVGGSRKDITSENIEQYRAVLVGDEHHHDRRWPIQRCLSWETIYKGNKYVLSEGSWYAVAQDFFKEINDHYLTKLTDRRELPKPSNAKLKESDYNDEVTGAIPASRLFDLGHAKSRHRSIGTDANEVCDVYNTTSKTFYHVKKGKTSADISHLFRQGLFSATALRQDERSLKQFIGHLINDGCTPDTIELPFNTADYTIAFVIVLGDTQKRDIPFFSKVSLRDTSNSLTLMNYQCNIAYVGGR